MLNYGEEGLRCFDDGPSIRRVNVPMFPIVREVHGVGKSSSDMFDSGYEIISAPILISRPDDVDAYPWSRYPTSFLVMTIFSYSTLPYASNGISVFLG